MSANAEHSVHARSYPVPERFSAGNWDALSVFGEDLYFALCSHKPRRHVTLCRMSLADRKLRLVDSLAELFTAEDGSIAQGMIHTRFVRRNHEVLFGTHLGSYPKDTLHGLGPYCGGHLVALDPTTNRCRSLGIPREGEGIVALAYQADQDRLFLSLSPSGAVGRWDFVASRFVPIVTPGPCEHDMACRNIGVTLNGTFLFTTGADATVYAILPDGQVIRSEPKLLHRANLDFFRGQKRKMELMLHFSSSTTPANNLIMSSIPSESAKDTLYVSHYLASLLLRINASDMTVNVVGRLVPQVHATDLDMRPYYPTMQSLAGDEKRGFYYIAAPRNGVPPQNGENLGCRVLHMDVSNGHTSDLGQVVIEDGRRAMLCATLSLTSESLWMVAWVELTALSAINEFLAGKPPMMDHGLPPQTNPWEMRLLEIPFSALQERVEAEITDV